MTNDIFVAFDACDGIILELDALETAILETCNIETAQAIQARKKVLMKK